MEGLKGVMLCQRPVDAFSAKLGDAVPFKPSSGTAQLEHVGITPSKKVALAPVLKKRQTALDKHRKLVYALAKDVKQKQADIEAQQQIETQKRQRIADFGQQLRATILSNQDTTGFWAATMHAAAISELQKTGRSAVASITSAGPSVYDPRDHRTHLLTSTATSRSAPGLPAEEQERIRAEMSTFVDATVTEAAQETARWQAEAAAASSAAAAAAKQPPQQTITEVPRAATPEKELASSTAARVEKKKRGSNLPAWALTEEKLEQLEEAEEDELLRFTEDLDFGKFLEQLDDVGLQETLKELEEADKMHGTRDEGAWKRTFVRAMNHMANRQAQAMALGRARLGGEAEGSVCGDDDDGAASTISRCTASHRAKSEAAAAKRAALAAKREDDGWDTSTRADDPDVGRMEVTSRTQEAEEFLRENPELQEVHSVASVRAMMIRAQAQTVMAAS